MLGTGRRCGCLQTAWSIQVIMLKFASLKKIFTVITDRPTDERKVLQGSYPFSKVRENSETLLLFA